jgi:hypothetical protein
VNRIKKNEMEKFMQIKASIRSLTAVAAVLALVGLVGI